MTTQRETAAKRIKREAAARNAVMAAAQRWHALMHTGPFDRCPKRVCYAGHPLVIE